MIISKGRGYVFVHIPKTGGTALSLALEERAKKDDILIGDTPKAQRRKHRLDDLKPAGRLWKHATLANIDGIVTPDELSAMFCFTLVRNPWDRMVSYYHWLREQEFDHPAVSLAQASGFEEFVRHPDTVRAFRNWPASAYMRDATGIERCNAYIRIEKLKDDIKPLQAYLGFDLHLDRVNVSQREADYRGYYDAGLRNFLGQLCAEDIAAFGYDF